MGAVINNCISIITVLGVLYIDTTLCDLNDEFNDHRIKLLEESVRTFVHETQPEVARIEKELEDVKEENRQLKTQIEDQQNNIADLTWAAYDIQSRTLSREERDLVTELKWTVFDLKAANAELQEEACQRSTVCKDWSAWTACSATCGPGTKIRSRHCQNDGRFSSMCELSTTEEAACNNGKCPPVMTFPQLDCQDGYESYQGFCFRFSGRMDARLLSTILCEDEGAHLVSIEDIDKQKIVFDYVNIVAPSHMADLHEDFSKREYWDFKDIPTKTNIAIDGVRKHQLTYFLNWKSQVMSFFNWATGQPRNRQSDGDYCVTLNVLTGEWYMNCCSVTFFYVCESERREDSLRLGG